MKVRLFACLLLMSTALSASAAIPADWTTPLAPFQIADHLYYVGSRDLASYLVTTPKGNILINANLDSSPALIRKSVESLGFRWADIRILLSSQAHYDHVAGAAEVLRTTHALHEVMDGDVAVVRDGGASDFDPTMPRFAPTRVDHVLHDLDTVSLGSVTITAHKTAGHTRGCTTWTMQTRAAGRPVNVVIVGGWSSNPGVRLVSTPADPASYPEIASDFEHAFATYKALPCDIFLGAHGVYFDMLAKLARMPKEGQAVWIDPAGYRRAEAEKEAAFLKELASEQAAPAQ